MKYDNRPVPRLIEREVRKTRYHQILMTNARRRYRQGSGRRIRAKDNLNQPGKGIR